MGRKPTSKESKGFTTQKEINDSGERGVFNTASGFIAISREFSRDAKNMSPSTFLLYCYFKGCINLEKWNDEHVFPSYKAIKEDIGIKSPTTISNCIFELVTKGWISKIEHPKQFNFQGNYTLNDIPSINHKLVKKLKEQRELNSQKAKKTIEKKKLDKNSENHT